MYKNLKSNLDLLDYWDVIWSAKFLLAALVLISVVATGVISKLSPRLYEAKSTLLPVREEAMGGGISFGGAGKEKGSGGGSASMMMEMMGGKSSGPTAMDTLNVLLLSRRMAEAVVDQLNLMEYYGSPSKARAAATLQGQVTVKQTAFKSLEITVLTQNREKAAEIANAYVSNLDRLNKELTITAAKRNRLFIEARLAEKTKKLEEAEEILKNYQTEHHILVTREGEKAAASGPMDAAVTLHSEIVSLEVELAALQSFALPNHPMVTQIQAKIDALKKQLDRMELDEASRNILKRRTRPPLSQKVFPLVEEAPTEILQLLRLNRQVKVEEAVYAMLVGSLEAARIAEVKDLPTVQPLDIAVPPEFHSRPRTLQNVEIAAGVSLILGILLVIFLDHLQRLKAQRVVPIVPEPVLGELALGESNGHGNGNGEVLPVPPKQSERLHG